MMHTPGPWEWVNGRNDEPWTSQSEGYPSLRTVAVFGENKTEIIDGKSYTSFALPKFILNADDAPAPQDMALLAAAPDMLAALKKIAKADGPYDVDLLGHANNTVESMKALALAAIAKAEGSP